MRAPRLSASATALAAVGIAWSASAAETRAVIEAAELVHFDTAARVLVVHACRSCPKIPLNVTDDTRVQIDGKFQPFDKQVLNGPFDTVYELEGRKILWLRPIPVVEK